MDLKYLKRIAIYVLSAIVSIALIAYVVYHLIISFGVEVETLPATLYTERETVAFDFYIMRDETILYSDSIGEVNCLYEDGTKVSLGAEVANVYSGGVTSVRSSIMELDGKIAILEDSNMPEGMSIYDTTAIDARIDELYYTILTKTEEGSLEYALHKKDELLTLLNKRQIIVNKVTSYNDKIAALEAEKASLTSQLNNITATVKTSSPGYFYSSIDGYENIFSSRRVDEMTLDDFERMTSSEPDTSLSGGGVKQSVGKLITDFTWYAACRTTKDQLRYFTEGRSYDVIFPYSSDTQLKMKLHRVISQTDRDDVVLVFSCGKLPVGFNFLRMQSVRLVKSSYTGYKVPLSALRMVGGVPGVYVLKNNVVGFKEVVTLYEMDGYLIAAEQDRLNDESYADKLGLYDQIIVQGKNIYEGRIID